MSKWIQGFPPCRNGNYLVIMNYQLINDPNYQPLYSRLEFDSVTQIWMDSPKSNGFVAFNRIFSPIWWDEFGIANNKIVVKLSFTKPQNREI